MKTPKRFAKVCAAAFSCNAFLLGLTMAWGATGAAAADQRFILGMHYGVEVYTIGQSCRPDAIFMDVESPLIADHMQRDNSWHKALRMPMERFGELCSGDPFQNVTTTLRVQMSGETIMTGRMFAGRQSGYDYSLTPAFQNYLVIRDAKRLADFSGAKPTGLPSEKFWSGDLSLDPPADQILRARDTAQDYFALAFRRSGGTGLNDAGRMVRLPATTEFGGPLANAKRQDLEAAAAIGYPPALEILANALIEKMTARSSSGLTYRPEQLSDDERDALLLHVVKMYALNYIAGISRGQLLTQLGLDTGRALSVVHEVGPSASIAHLRAAPGTERAPTRYEIGRAFGPALLDENCGLVAAVLNGETVSPLLATVERKGDTCVFTQGPRLEGAARVTLALDRVYDPSCTGDDGAYACSFQYNLRCRIESGPAQSKLFNAMYCAPFRAARQPVAARLRRLDSGGWEVTEFALAQP